MLKAPVGASVESLEMSAFLPPWIWVMPDGSVLGMSAKAVRSYSPAPILDAKP